MIIFRLRQDSTQVTVREHMIVCYLNCTVQTQNMIILVHDTRCHCAIPHSSFYSRPLQRAALYTSRFYPSWRHRATECCHPACTRKKQEYRKKFSMSLIVDHNHNCRSKQNNSEWNSTVGGYGTTCLVFTLHDCH